MYLGSYSSAFNVAGRLPPPLFLSILTAITLNVIAGLSRAAVNFLLVSLSAIVAASLELVVDSRPDADGAGKPSQSAIGNYKWPFDIHTAIKEFELNPHLIYYVCCPACSALYAYDPTKKIQKLPSLCTHVFLGELCTANLLQPNSKPIRQFAYQSLSSWLAGFLSQPGIVDILKTKVSETNPGCLADHDLNEAPIESKFTNSLA
jgi:hypothetical protein